MGLILTAMPWSIWWNSCFMSQETETQISKEVGLRLQSWPGGSLSTQPQGSRRSRLVSTRSLPTTAWDLQSERNRASSEINVRLVSLMEWDSVLGAHFSRLSGLLLTSYCITINLIPVNSMYKYQGKNLFLKPLSYMAHGDIWSLQALPVKHSCSY